MSEQSARDFAATVRKALPSTPSSVEQPSWLSEAYDALAALVKQAEDAQVARAVAEAAKTLWDDANKRAVRAEEALRQIRSGLNDGCPEWRIANAALRQIAEWPHPANESDTRHAEHGMRTVAIGALAAAGADTPGSRAE